MAHCRSDRGVARAIIGRGTRGRETSVGIGVTKVFKADLRRLPLAQQGKALDWLLAFTEDPDDPRFGAHRLKRAIMPDLWTAKLDNAYRVIYRQSSEGTRYLLLVDHHDTAYRRAEKLKVVNEGGLIDIVEDAEQRACAEDGAGRGAARHGRGQTTAPAVGRTFMAWRDDELLR
jgi:mRNA-degrading endonuclease RelE of RelBE toxin-antitoxin system